MFCRRHSEVGVLEQVGTWLRLNVFWCSSEGSKYKKCKCNDGQDDFLLNCIIGCKKHAVDLALTTSRFSQAFLQESFTRNWLLWFKVEPWNFT